MVSRLDLEAICSRLEDPFEGSRKALEGLKGHALKTKTDAMSYAGKMLDIYETVIGRINRDLDDTRRRAEILKDQYSSRREERDAMGFLYESDPGFYLGDIDNRLSDAVSAAQLKKEGVVKTLRRELAGQSVDVRTKRRMVILETKEGRHGFYLDNPNRHMRDVSSIWTPFGPFYRLVGGLYHIPKIIGR